MGYIILNKLCTHNRNYHPSMIWREYCEGEINKGNTLGKARL